MKRQVVSSNWRDDLSEYVDISNVSPKKAKTDTKSREKVEEKEVNNKVVINPPMTEAFEELGGTIISIEEEKNSGYQGGGHGGGDWGLVTDWIKAVKYQNPNVNIFQIGP